MVPAIFHLRDTEQMFKVHCANSVYRDAGDRQAEDVSHHRKRDHHFVDIRLPPKERLLTEATRMGQTTVLV
jgi:hypothetical protein